MKRIRELMTDYDRWDVLTALFPFTDVTVKKPRPVLVLSTPVFMVDHQHVIGAMITTASNSVWPTDFTISDLTAAGISHPSVVRWKVFTLPLDNIGKKIGRLSENDIREITKVYRGVFLE